MSGLEEAVLMRTEFFQLGLEELILMAGNGFLV